MTGALPSLTFHHLDDVSLGATRGRIRGYHLPPVVVRQLGPLLEFEHLRVGSPELANLGEAWIEFGDLGPLIGSLRRGTRAWISSDRCSGYLMLTADDAGDRAWTDFVIKAKRAAVSAGLTPDVAGQLVAAIGELRSNTHQHSQDAQSGMLAYRATVHAFEFVVADRGIGVLPSLRTNPRYAALDDHGMALRLALRDGVSNSSELGRGLGFRPLFIGLASLFGSLRFRSGDHALEIVGTNPCLPMAQVSQKSLLDGFYCSVICDLARPGLDRRQSGRSSGTKRAPPRRRNPTN